MSFKLILSKIVIYINTISWKCDPTDPRDHVSLINSSTRKRDWKKRVDNTAPVLTKPHNGGRDHRFLTRAATNAPLLNRQIVSYGARRASTRSEFGAKPDFQNDGNKRLRVHGDGEEARAGHAANRAERAHVENANRFL